MIYTWLALMHSSFLFVSWCFLTGPDNLQIDVSQLQSGRHTLQLTGTDSVGNTATSRSDFVIRE